MPHSWWGRSNNIDDIVYGTIGSILVMVIMGTVGAGLVYIVRGVEYVVGMMR